MNSSEWFSLFVVININVTFTEHAHNEQVHLEWPKLCVSHFLCVCAFSEIPLSPEVLLQASGDVEERCD